MQKKWESWSLDFEKKIVKKEAHLIWWAIFCLILVVIKEQPF